MYDAWNKLKSRIVDLKGLVSIGIADIVGNGLTVIFWLYIVSVIDPNTYGEIQYYLGIAGVASYIAIIGTIHTLTVYSAKKIPLQSTLAMISLIVGIISSSVIIIFFNRIDAGLIVIAYVINTLVIGELLGKKLFVDYSKYVLIQKALTLVLGIGFYFIFGAEGIIYALALTYIFFLIRVVRSFKESKIDLKLFKVKFGFIANNYALSLSGGMVGQVDKLIVGPLLGFTLLGNYALSLQIFGVLMIFSNIVFKFVLSNDATGNINKKLKIGSVLISIGIAAFGIIVVPYFIPIMFPKYLEVIDAIKIVSIAIIPATIHLMYGSKFLGFEKSRFVLMSTLISLSSIIIGMIILGSMWGINGIALAYVISSSAEAIFLVIMDRKYLKKDE